MPYTVKLGAGAKAGRKDAEVAAKPLTMGDKKLPGSGMRPNPAVLAGVMAAVCVIALAIWLIMRSGDLEETAPIASPGQGVVAPPPAPPGGRSTPGGMGPNGPIIPGPP